MVGEKADRGSSIRKDGEGKESRKTKAHRCIRRAIATCEKIAPASQPAAALCRMDFSRPVPVSPRVGEKKRGTFDGESLPRSGRAVLGKQNHRPSLLLNYLRRTGSSFPTSSRWTQCRRFDLLATVTTPPCPDQLPPFNGKKKGAGKTEIIKAINENKTRSKQERE